MGRNKYIDNVLISLKREYQKDELVSYLIKIISNLEIENGKLKSYVAELEFKEESVNKYKKEVVRLHKAISTMHLQKK